MVPQIYSKYAKMPIFLDLGAFWQLECTLTTTYLLDAQCVSLFTHARYKCYLSTQSSSTRSTQECPSGGQETLESIALTPLSLPR